VFHYLGLYYLILVVSKINVISVCAIWAFEHFTVDQNFLSGWLHVFKGFLWSLFSCEEKTKRCILPQPQEYVFNMDVCRAYGEKH
jgi:hypothetical protein